jgi:hypothetical protein
MIPEQRLIIRFASTPRWTQCFGEREEQTLIRIAHEDAIFRMPLNADSEGQIGPLHGLDDAIGRSRRNHQFVTELVHGLMVA